MKTIFEKAYAKLNPEQKQAVDTIEGPVMVIAGPGTGKTQVLILRIARILLQTQVEPENILALTFTESAAHEMRQRLVSLIGSPGYRVEIQTFHGFCNRIIQYNNTEFDDLIAAENIDELEQIEIIEEVLEEGSFRFIRPFGSPLYYLKSIIGSISELKKEGISPERFLKAVRKQEKLLKKDSLKTESKTKFMVRERQILRNLELAEVYGRYEAVLKKTRKYDYNDMLLHVIRAFMKNKNLLLQTQELFQYILVDEHQDTNKAQNTIIELLCNYHANPNLFVVGDEKQAIFRFQGATLENFLYFRNLYKNAVLINLRSNYRSTQTILSAAQSLIRHNRLRGLDSKLVAVKKEYEFPVNIAELSSFFAEYRFVSDDIKRRLDKNINPGEIAVLLRTNRDVDEVALHLSKEGIPYCIDSEQGIFSEPTVRKLVSLFYAISRLGSDRELIEVMHLRIFHIDPYDIFKLMDHARVKKKFLWEVVTNDDTLQELHLASSDQIRLLIARLKKWKTLSMNESFDNVFISVLNESGLLPLIMAEKENLSIIEKISALFNEIKRRVAKSHNFRLTDFIEYIEKAEKHGLSLSMSSRSPYREGVRLMTAHKSKGQEFEYVYIMNAYDGHWGNKRKSSKLFHIPWDMLSVKFDVRDEEENEDERRLFYVALTRAKKEATITYSKRDLEGNEQTMSQFIQEIHPRYRRIIDTSSFEREFALHPERLLLPVRIKETESVLRKTFLENRSFFNRLYIHRGLSVSGLNNYLECPWKFFYRNLLLMPDVKNKQLIFGTAIHEALNSYLIIRKTGPVRVDRLLEEYKKALSKQSVSTEELNELVVKGMGVLRAYYENRAAYWSAKMEGELSIRGIRFTENIHLNGKIDMIERLNNSGAVRIYDFKTGKPKSRSHIEGKLKNKSSGEYKRQLVFYKILLDRFKAGKLKMNEGVIEFIEPNDRGIFISESFIIKKDEIAEVKKLILQVSDEIFNLAFIDKTCGDSDCQYCKLKSFMTG